MPPFAPRRVQSVTSPSRRPIFDSYTLPLPRRRHRSATAVSLAVHVAIAFLVLWRGAVLVENAWGGTRLPESGRSAGRPATVWMVMPPLPSSPDKAPAVRQPTPKRATIAQPFTDPVKLALSATPRLVLAATPAAIATVSLTVSDPADEPGTGAGTDTSAASDIFGPTPSLLPTAPAGAPAGEKGQHEVRFWIGADGQVTRIEVIPRIRDSDYRRRFMEAMSGFAFGPAKTRDGRPIEYVYSVIVHP